MSSKVKYNDGESLVSADFNSLQDYQRKVLFDSVLLNLASEINVPWNGFAVGSGLQLRSLGSAGFIKRQSANQIRVFGGLWVAFTAGTPADPSVPVSKVANKDTFADFSIANAPSGQLRRDIVQCQLVETDETPVSRHFKDAVTGALSSASLVKRSNISVTYAVKAGVAGLPAVEPAADSGWTKIGSVLVSDTGLAATATFYDSDYWDWREPWGLDENYTLIDGRSSASGWILSATALGSTAGAVPITLLAPKLHSSIVGDPSASAGPVNCRVLQVILGADWGGVPLAGTFSLGYSSVDRQVPPGFGTTVVTDVSSLVSAATTHVIYNYATDPPLWSNGRPNAYGAPRRQLCLYCNPQGQAGKILSGVIWRVRGTF